MEPLTKEEERFFKVLKAKELSYQYLISDILKDNNRQNEAFWKKYIIELRLLNYLSDVILQEECSYDDVLYFLNHHKKYCPKQSMIEQLIMGKKIDLAYYQRLQKLQKIAFQYSLEDEMLIKEEKAKLLFQANIVNMSEEAFLFFIQEEITKPNLEPEVRKQLETVKYQLISCSSKEDEYIKDRFQERNSIYNYLDEPFSLSDSYLKEQKEKKGAETINGQILRLLEIEDETVVSHPAKEAEILLRCALLRVGFLFLDEKVFESFYLDFNSIRHHSIWKNKTKVLKAIDNSFTLARGDKDKVFPPSRPVKRL